MKSIMKSAVTFFIGILIALFILAPIIWTLISSLKPSSEILRYPPTVLPNEITFIHYVELFRETLFPSYFLNSLLVGIIATPLTLLVAAPGAYSLTRFRYRGKDIYATFLLFCYMVPLLLLGLPMFMIMSRLGILNTRLSLVVSYVAFCLPFCMWVLRSFFASIPTSLEEAAMVDGATRIQALTKVVLPLSMPGLISCGIFTFILVWNEYTLALLFIRSEHLKTLPLGMVAFMGRVASQWNYLLPAIILMIAPILVVFMIVQKALVRGFLAGATKG
ncbi:MAG: carbohydrate ABC transporter permease [Deltaproteobacteria bacterium]|nr:carbohydrate ABC transporter permease [Deltaproteobacteria bacterium]MBW2121939.1 carbohydrate ABC transporter permease [Deltaproteobacteria bacterium]